MARENQTLEENKMKLSLLLTKIGSIFLTIEGFYNVLWWKYKAKELKDKYPHLPYQIGRFLRGFAGLLFTLFYW